MKRRVVAAFCILAAACTQQPAAAGKPPAQAIIPPAVLPPASGDPRADSLLAAFAGATTEAQESALVEIERSTDAFQSISDSLRARLGSVSERMASTYVGEFTGQVDSAIHVRYPGVELSYLRPGNSNQLWLSRVSVERSDIRLGTVTIGTPQDSVLRRLGQPFRIKTYGSDRVVLTYLLGETRDQLDVLIVGNAVRRVDRAFYVD